MEKILVLTHIYPGEGTPDTFTPVVHYFTKEWVKLGYDVRVIHISNYFPHLYYCVPQFVNKLVTRKYGCPLPDKRLDKSINYCLDGVKVVRFPMFKIFPGGKYPEKSIDTLFKQICSYIEKEGFKPDFCIAHWTNPQAPLLKKIKERYNCKTALVLHDDGRNIQKYNNWKDIYKSIDVWGYRSDSVKNGFEELFGKNNHMFRCCSGIPQYYYENQVLRDLKKTLNRFVYVGQLIQRKYADVVIRALAKSFPSSDFTLNLIGDGDEKNSLIKIASDNQVSGNVKFWGRIKRAEVVEILDKADVFCMISKHEVFGLVYLEAMARGCIVVASRGEGMQGIIEDGINGFLCEPGNELELINIISRIKKLSSTEKQVIIANAMQTASKFSDTNVALDYINKVKY